MPGRHGWIIGSAAGVKRRRKLVEGLFGVVRRLLLAGGQDLRHKIGAALPLGGDGLAVRSRQVIVFREILPELGGERLHALGQRAAGLIHDVQAPLHRHPFPHPMPSAAMSTKMSARTAVRDLEIGRFVIA